MPAGKLAYYKYKILPSQGSGSVRDAKSSIENLTSTPFSNRDSGSAFNSQYDLSEESGVSSASDFVAVLGCVVLFAFFDCGFFYGTLRFIYLKCNDDLILLKEKTQILTGDAFELGSFLEIFF